MIFKAEEFVEPIYNLKKNEGYKYPANAYQTVYRVKNLVEGLLGRKYEDRALNPTYRIIFRMK